MKIQENKNKLIIVVMVLIILLSIVLYFFYNYRIPSNLKIDETKKITKKIIFKLKETSLKENKIKELKTKRTAFLQNYLLMNSELDQMFDELRKLHSKHYVYGTLDLAGLCEKTECANQNKKMNELRDKFHYAREQIEAIDKQIKELENQI
ncbi:hypothetical protein CWO85_02445 [Candidatus Phytoplasma ziziphi]|uniref:Uncharacterized protein n=1 Tax=Ziziphus jujuba witches'-broom phytoplasma TaxID=135727 RepID=A0A660HMS5_ZIZJU|nr:hypothetical protein [Candidatus Phytoplasma ziziphi]AYJ01350.1 hypothetical protein CWO85_02445 [Candidatus Phytoplasma ziziphi]